MARPSLIPKRVRDLEHKFRKIPGFLHCSLRISARICHNATCPPFRITAAETKLIHHVWRFYCAP